MGINTFTQLDLVQARITDVPEGWLFGKVSDVLKIRNNLRKPISQEVRATIQGPYPYYGPTKIQDYISGFEQDGTYALIGEDGDHFLKFKTMSQTQFISGKCTVNNHAHILESSEICTSEWFYNYFKHRDITNFLSRQGAGRFKLNKATLEKLPMLVPPLSEQRKIAKILSTWDKAIVTTEKLIDVSRQQKKALMQQLLTGKKRLLNPKTGIFFSGKREDVKLKDCAKQLSQKNNLRHDYPVLSCSKHKGFVDSLKYFKKKVYSDDTSGYRIIPKGCFGFPANHIEEGSIGLQNLYDYGLVSPIYVVFEIDSKIVSGKYLHALLKTDRYRQIFAASTNASVDRRGSLRWKEFSLIKVVLPSLPEQQKIAQVLSSADKEIEILEAKLVHLRQEKKALMQQLLTGKRRVLVGEQVDEVAA